ncbi:YicC family protein [Candidatus Marinimicrobia bacterium MT.SAG.3]|nr:YicC family protein [Candidatus Marinimicrobia bacterium MT.SAG.3]TFB12636.1 YicC family protein [Candidatus Marinimicrobia bacterium MT.SAG.4]
MLQSMTGFGRGEALGEKCVVSIELRSVNNRYCDVIMRNNKGYMAWDEEIKKQIQKRLKRGKIFCNLHIEESKSNGGLSKLDSEAVKNYANLLGEIKKHAGIEEPIKLSHLLGNNNIFFQPSKDDIEELKKLAFEALEDAITELTGMRNDEGEKLSSDIVERASDVNNRVEEIGQLSENNSSKQFEKLKLRVDELLRERIEPGKLDHELAVLSDKLDITEECVRLKSHIKQFLTYIEIDEPVGKRLDFLLQEMNRESNTIASKSNENGIAHIVVEMKNQIESMREQVQNVI